MNFKCNRNNNAIRDEVMLTDAGICICSERKMLDLVCIEKIIKK